LLVVATIAAVVSAICLVSLDVQKAKGRALECLSTECYQEASGMTPSASAQARVLND